MASRILSVRLAADVAAYVAGMTQAADATERVTSAGQRLQDSGASATKRWTLPILGAGAASAKSAIQFESAFTGVQKTVDATAGELARLRDGIIAMSKEVPSSREEIAAIAEAAGQLGIETGSILDFTRVIIDLGNATNIVGQEGAAQLARLANITQMPQDKFENLGSAVVALGNNMATTEADIVSMSLRLAGAGNVVGLTEADILALAAALSSVGIEAEAGGSAMSTAMLRMQKAVSDGSSELATFAKTAGMTSTEFAQLFRSDAASALDAFVQGLGRLQSSGGDAAAVLESLGITEIRMRQAFLGLAGAGDVLTRSLSISKDAWAQNNALAAEASLRYATTESRLRIMVNKLTEVGRKVGDLLIPVVIAGANVVGVLADGAGALVDVFGRLPEPIQWVAGGFVALAAAAGPTIWALGKIVALAGPLRGAMLMISSAKLASGFVSSAAGLAGWVRSVQGAVAAMHAATVTGVGLKSAMLGLGAAIGPQVAVVAALTAAWAAFQAIRRSQEEFAAKNQTAAESAESLAESVGLASGEIRGLNAAMDETGKRAESDNQFAAKNAEAVATLRALAAESEKLAQGRLVQIAFRLQLEGNSPEDVREAVERLANVAGVKIPVELDADGVDVDALVESIRQEAETLAMQTGTESVFGRVLFGEVDRLTPEARKRIESIARSAADLLATDDISGFARAMAEAELAMGDNAQGVETLADQMLRLSGVQGVSTVNTYNLRDALDELSRSSSISAENQEKFASWVDATEGMSAAEAAAKILELALADTADAADGAGDAAEGAGDGFDTAAAAADGLSAAVAGAESRLALARLEFDAGEAAAKGWSAAMEMARQGASRLSAGLSAGRSWKSFKEGMTGAKRLADASERAGKRTEKAATAVDRLGDAARRADPKMSAFQVRLDALAAAGDAFSKSIDNSSMLDDQISSALNLGDAFRDFEKTYRRLPHTLDMTAMATGKLRPRTVEAIQNMLGLGKAARDYLATLIEMGRSEGEVRAEAGKMRAEYSRMFRQMGMNEAQVRSYIEAMGLLPSQIDTAVKLSGVEMARTQLSAYLSLLEGRIPPSVATSVIAKLDRGDIDGAAKELANFAKSNPAVIEVAADTSGLASARDEIEQVKSSLWSLPQTFDPLKALLGEYTDEQMAALDAVIAFGDGVQNYLSRVAHDGNYEEIKKQAYQIRDAFLEQLKSFGIVGDAAQEYLDLIGLSDWQIESAITLSGDTEAMFRIQMYSQLLADEIPPEVATNVMTLIDHGKLQEASLELSRWREREMNRPLRLQVIADAPMGRSYDGGLFYQASRVRGKRASGGPVQPGRWLVGEQGPEIVEINGSGQVYNAADTARMLAPGVPVGANLASVPGPVALDSRTVAAIERAAGSKGVEFSGDFNIRAVDPKQSAREIVERVGGALFRGGR